MREHEEVFEWYKLDFPKFAAATVKWWPSGHYEITAVLTDGYTLAYNSITHIMSHIRPYTDTDDKKVHEAEWRERFGRNLDRKMYARGITPAEMSRLTGISARMITYYTKGLRMPSAINVSKMAEALKCPISDLYQNT